ncbi:MAG: N-acetylmuramoyl-L-alanine amidase, partial [Planctomycetes bacterium]|nr:N-acetylmuramoyl-L-alanine amidase [Planctomycetota bacterium]
MPRSRMVKTLMALLGAMTVGAFLLLALETTPARPNHLMALAARFRTTEADEAGIREIFRTNLPIQQWKWRNIVIHDSICCPAADPVAGSHFVILGAGSTGHDGTLQATTLWQQQADGSHLAMTGCDYDASSIGICLVGDFSATPPTREQMANLLGLV